MTDMPGSLVPLSCRPPLRYDGERNGPLAQLVEQQTLNLRVLGSIPRRLTTSPNLPSLLAQEVSLAKVAELVYALDLGSSPERSGWGFESPLSHQDHEANLR